MASDTGPPRSSPSHHPAPEKNGLAVLASGGLDSAILLAESLQQWPAVYPLYIRHGLFWEESERQALERFLEAIPHPALRPLHILEMPVGDLYGNHWSIDGHNIPGADSPDEAVFLPGRNVLLLAKAMLWCHLHQGPALALAPLESNPFPDATPDFFRAFQKVVNQGIGSAVEVLRPYARLSKAEVLRRGRDLPLHLTMSCLRPVAGRHCGACNKCAERRRAFADAGIIDRTDYASPASATPAP
jgi:7-cyano-7-deazaguanine synthase